MTWFSRMQGVGSFLHSQPHLCGRGLFKRRARWLKAERGLVQVQLLRLQLAAHRLKKDRQTVMYSSQIGLNCLEMFLLIGSRELSMGKLSVMPSVSTGVELAVMTMLSLVNLKFLVWCNMHCKILELAST